jgi:hypothetical protein
VGASVKAIEFLMDKCPGGITDLLDLDTVNTQCRESLPSLLGRSTRQ